MSKIPEDIQHLTRESGEVLRRLTFEALDALQLRAEAGVNGSYVLSIPDTFRELAEGLSEVTFTFSSQRFNDPEARPCEYLSTDSKFWKTLVEQLKELGDITYAEPSNQPADEEEIARIILHQYKAENGTIEITESRVEERPILKVVFLHQDHLFEIFVNEKGEHVSEELISALSLRDIKSLHTAPDLPEEELLRLLHVAKKKAVTKIAVDFGEKISEQRETVSFTLNSGSDLNGTNPSEESSETSDDEVEANFFDKIDKSLAVIHQTLIWCKHTEGKINIHLGDRDTEHAFSGWASSLRPDPLICPQTGEKTFHLAMTDDHRIAALEQIGECNRTKQRALLSELIECPITKQFLLEEFITECPITSEKISRDSAISCETCQQLVSPRAFKAGSCFACAKRKLISKDDPRMARILGEYPGLDRWRKWHISETHTIYNLTASQIYNRILIILNKDNMEVIKISTRGFFSKQWKDLSEKEMNSIIR